MIPSQYMIYFFIVDFEIFSEFLYQFTRSMVNVTLRLEHFYLFFFFTYLYLLKYCIIIHLISWYYIVFFFIKIVRILFDILFIEAGFKLIYKTIRTVM